MTQALSVNLYFYTYNIKIGKGSEFPSDIILKKGFPRIIGLHTPTYRHTHTHMRLHIYTLDSQGYT